MFRKIALILFTFIVLISSLISFPSYASEPDYAENDSPYSELCNGKCPIVKLSNSGEEISEENDSKSVSLCGTKDSCPITGISNNYNSNFQSFNSDISQKSSTLTFAISVLRFVAFVITGLSFLAILGGLIATVFLSIKRKKFALNPFLVFGFGIGFLIISIICLTIINLASSF